MQQADYAGFFLHCLSSTGTGGQERDCGFLTVSGHRQALQTLHALAAWEVKHS